jgi:hypothetical protein
MVKSDRFMLVVVVFSGNVIRLARPSKSIRVTSLACNLTGGRCNVNAGRLTNCQPLTSLTSGDVTTNQPSQFETGDIERTPPCRLFVSLVCRLGCHKHKNTPLKYAGVLRLNEFGGGEVYS